MDLILFDTETTGFGKCRMVEIAWKRNDEPIRAMRVKPPIPVEEQAISVHGITNEMCELYPPFRDRPEYPVLKELFEGAVMIAHQARFDVDVLEREGIVIRNYIDTKKVAQKIYPHAPGYKLQRLREHFGLKGGEAHSAAGDVATLEQLFLLMARDMENLGTAPDDVIRQMAVATLH